MAIFAHFVLKICTNRFRDYTTNAGEPLLQTSWSVDRNNGDEPGKDDYGKIIYDKGKENYKEGEYDPWTEGYW